MITNKKAITPIVASILLIVVAVILVTIVLNWGRSFSNSSLATADTEKLSKSDASEFVYTKAFSDGVIQFNYAPPDSLTSQNIIITGYKIFSDNNETAEIVLDSNHTLRQGLNVIPLTDFSDQNITSRKMNIQLHTSDGKYITLNNVTNNNPYVILELPYIMNGETKLYIHPTDNSTGNITWGCSGTLIGAGAQSATDGATNTAAIIAGCATSPIAASVCENLEAYGYDNWYLPAKDQLAAIWNACTEVTKSNACMNAAINKGDYTEEWSNIVNDLYWSSTETWAGGAYGIDMDGGHFGSPNKTDTSYVRCVRDQ
ncbi:MAG TPA: DUF1566 domain-containing protein [archaeon]|mgnify:CR=1 FL=1|nr:DUF1566 domain-containing protein [archaeon]